MQRKRTKILALLSFEERFARFPELLEQTYAAIDPSGLNAEGRAAMAINLAAALLAPEVRVSARARRVRGPRRARGKLLQLPKRD